MSAPASKKKKASLDSVKYAFREIIWPRRGLLFLGLLLIVINRGAGFVLPLSTRFLIDDIIGQNKIDQLMFFIGGVGLAIAIQSITSFFLTKLLSVEAQHLIAQLRLKVQKHIVRLPVSYFDNHKSGELVSRIMSDVEGVRNLVGTGLVQLVGGLLTAVVSFAYLLNQSFTLTMIALVPIVLFSVVSFKAFSYIRPVFRDRGKIRADVTGRLTESLNGVRVVKGFNAEAQEVEVFEGGVMKLFQNVRKTLTTTSLITSVGTFLIGLASLGVMWYGSLEIIAGKMTVGSLFEFTLLLGFMIVPIVQMSNIGTQMTEAFAGLDRMAEILDKTLESDDGDRNISLPEMNGDFEMKDVSFAYEEGKEVLHHINFIAPAGSVTALVGSSGSGKSTISSLTGAYLKPTKGQVLVDGHDLSELKLEDFRQHLGVVLQDDFLFEGTIRENILFPRPNATEEQLQYAVKAAYVNEFTERFEDGLETIIGERGVKLSGGQRQRVAIARAILADPKILILDEATSNLDTESEMLIQKSLSGLMENRTTIVIAHRLSTIRQADQILVVEAGEIVERGTHDELIEVKGRYFELFTYQSRI